MENTQPTKTKNESGSKVDTSDASTKSGLVAATEKNASTNLSQTITATMPKGSKKTLTSAALAELRLKAGLVAGALADFQAAGGKVLTAQVQYPHSGRMFDAIKLILFIEGENLVAEKTPDGLDIVAAPSGIVAE
jgi:hypothetical protein